MEPFKMEQTSLEQTSLEEDRDNPQNNASKCSAPKWMMWGLVLLLTFGAGSLGGYSIGKRCGIAENVCFAPFDGMRCAEILGKLRHLEQQSPGLHQETRDALLKHLSALITRQVSDLKKELLSLSHLRSGVSSFPSSPVSEASPPESSPFELPEPKDERG